MASSDISTVLNEIKLIFFFFVRMCSAPSKQSITIHFPSVGMLFLFIFSFNLLMMSSYDPTNRPPSTLLSFLCPPTIVAVSSSSTTNGRRRGTRVKLELSTAVLLVSGTAVDSSRGSNLLKRRASIFGRFFVRLWYVGKLSGSMLLNSSSIESRTRA